MTADVLLALADVKNDVANVSTKIDAVAALVQLDETPPSSGSPTLVREYGGTLSNAGNRVLDVSALRWLSDDPAPAVIEVQAASVNLDVIGLGGLDVGPAVANATYHFFAVRNPTTGETGVIASASPTLAAPPAGFTQKCRLGSIPMNGSALAGITQRGDEFLLCEPISFPSIPNPGILGTLRPTGCPTGIKVQAKLMVAMWTGSAAIRSLLVTSPDQSDVLATGTRFSLRSSGNPNDRQSSEFLVRTDTAGNFRTRMEASDTNSAIFYSCFGWVDSRGRGV